jgi:hypothetical protein
MRASLPEAIDMINAMLAREYAVLAKYSQVTNHINYMNETHQGKDNVPKTLSIIIQPLKARIINAIKNGIDTAKSKPAEAVMAAFDILKVAEPVRVIRSILHYEDHELIDLCDNAAEECLKCQIAYAMVSDDWSKSFEILDAASRYAASKETKEHIENERLKAAKNKHIGSLTKKINNIDTNDSTASKIRAIHNELIPHLSLLKSAPGMTGELYEHCADTVANYIRGLSISEYNENSNLQEALRILEISISIARGNEVREQLKNDKAQLLDIQEEATKHNLQGQLAEKIESIDSKDSTSLKMRAIENDLIPHLASLKSAPGMTGELYEHCADTVANYIRGLSISEYNENSNMSEALRIIEVSIAVACGNETRAQLQKDKAQLTNLQEESSAHNLQIDIRSDEIKVTNEFVHYNNQKLPVSSIQGIRYGVFVQYTNGIQTSSSYLIDITDGQSRRIKIECKRLLRSEAQAKQDFDRILDALFHQVVPSLVQRLAENVISGTPLQVGDCKVTKDGIYITTGVLLWKKETLVLFSDLRFSSGSGQISASSVKDKKVSTSMAIRDIWNVALLEFITKTVVEMKAKC